MSLQLKVNLFVSVMLLLSLTASSYILISNARKTVQTEVQDTMAATAHIITVTLAGTNLERNRGVSEHMFELVKALSEIRSLHILMFDRHGLMFEGQPPDDLLNRPPDWFVKLLFPDVKPLSRRFGEGHMVIYPAPLLEISERWRDLRAIMLLGIVMFISVGIILYWGGRRLVHPLQSLLNGLAGFEQGQYQLRLPKFPSSEMQRISDSFNQLGHALEKSTAENERLATLVRQSGDAILSLDRAGRITFCNATAERLFGDATSALVGTAFAELGLVEHTPKLLDIIQNAQQMENIDTRLQKQNGDKVSLLMSTVPLHERDGRIIGVICTLRDITEHQQAERARAQLYESRLLAKHKDETLEAERRHLARELHDELGQCLTAIKTDAVLIRNRTQTVEPKLFQSAQAIIDTASHIYDVVHNMITRLRPSPLDDLGLLATLQEAMNDWQRRHAAIRFNLMVEGSLQGLDETINMTIFRVVQEAITNAVRHAAATVISVNITRITQGGTEQLMINVRDNGKGMAVHDFHSDVDFGLLGMRERAQSLGGHFSLDSELGKGVNLTVTIPVKQAG